MSLYPRIQEHREELFIGQRHLKKYKKELAEILPERYTPDELLLAFKECYPYIWEQITYHCLIKKQDYYRRKKRGLRTDSFYTPEQFLLKHIHPLPKCKEKLSDEEKRGRRDSLKQIGLVKLQSHHERLKQKLVYVQETCPEYIHSLIDAYYIIRKDNTLDINIRYLILLEVSHFKCKETIQFLYKINSCEKNNNLREFAFHTLQKMGEHPWLARKRKGKQKQSQTKIVDIEKNPTELLRFLYKYQDYIYQEYDIFLSHSIKDELELIRIKNTLNKQGFSVYVDWINDREMLNRENQNEDTWDALFLRLKQSKRLLYVMTDNCILSKSTEKEVRYFLEMGNKVYYYKASEITLDIPEYIKSGVELFDLNNIKFD